MINFYKLWNGVGCLEGEQYSHLVAKLARNEFAKDLQPIEHIIKKDAHTAYLYAVALKHRFIEAEPVIMKDASIAYWYARNVMKVRWIIAEPYIRKDPEWWGWYRRYFGI